MMNIRKINLNLLVALDALLKEQNVSRAAQKIFITQPAMSNVLTQLRELLKDPLLVRSGKQMIPTPFALEIAPRVRLILQQIEETLTHNATFEPKTAQRTFTIAMSDYGEFVLLPYLSELLARLAPQIRLKIIHANMLDDAHLFIEGKIDLGIGITTLQAPFIESELLFTEEAVCVARAGHPAMKKLTLKKYLEAKHLGINYQAESSLTMTDNALQEFGYVRDVALAVPHIVSALHAMARTSMIATVPRRLALTLQRNLKLVIQKPPFAIPAVNVSMVWHKRFAGDAGHRWLREQIRMAAGASKIP